MTPTFFSTPLFDFRLISNPDWKMPWHIERRNTVFPDAQWVLFRAFENREIALRYFEAIRLSQSDA